MRSRSPWKQSSIHLEQVVSLLSEGGGEILFLNDGSKAMAQPLALALLCLIDEDPATLRALKRLILDCIERGQALCWPEWPLEMQALVDEESEIPLTVLAETYLVAIELMKEPKTHEWSLTSIYKHRFSHLLWVLGMVLVSDSKKNDEKL